MNRRSLFKALVVTAPVTVVGQARDKGEGRTRWPGSGHPADSRELIRLALIRLECLGIDETAAEADYTFCQRFIRDGMTDADLAEVLRPYYVHSIAPREVFAYAPPTVCARCGQQTMHVNIRVLPRLIMQCSNPDCKNHWPWIQDGDKVERISENAKRLIERMNHLEDKKWRDRTWGQFPGLDPGEQMELDNASALLAKEFNIA